MLSISNERTDECVLFIFNATRVSFLLSCLLIYIMMNENLDLATLHRFFANLALSCVHREYPNKIAHVLTSDADIQAPHNLIPAFYGCFD